jgi:hypothetical protein
VTKKPHPLKGRKKSAESIAKMKATLAEKKRLRELAATEAPSKPTRKYTKRQHPDNRTHEALVRDVKEAIWCLEKAVAGTRRAIAAGRVSLTDVTDEETFLYMAIRYLQGGLR